MITWILGALLICVVVYLIYILNELVQINKQLDYIYDHETNAELTHVSRNRILVQFVFKSNRIIRRMKAEERYRIQQERELYQTLTSLSHDLRTPLTTAYGYTQIVEENDPHNALIPKIRASLKETTSYLDSIVDYTSISEKTMELSLERIDLSEFITQQVLQYYDSMQGAGITLELDIQKKLYLISDVLLLKRISTNLIGNVIKYGADQCSIKLKETPDGISLMFENNTLKRIQDDQVITQRFVTQDTSRSNKSIGLGLNIIEKCCEILEAQMRVETKDLYFRVSIEFKNAL